MVCIVNVMKTDDQDGLQEPKRWPWLWLVLLALIVVAGWCRYVGCKSRRIPAPVQQVPTTVQTGPIVVTNKAPAQPAVISARVKSTTNAVSPSPRGTATNVAASAAINIPQLTAEAKAFEEKDDLVGARAKWRDVLHQATDARLAAEAEERIAKINIGLVLTPRPMPEKVDYVVQAGDSVEKIAKRFGTTIDLIQESNQLKNADLIKAGDRLVVLKGKVSIAVSKGRNDLIVRLDDQFFKRYRVGTGKYSKTPVGAFVVADRQEKPVWWRPDGKEIPYGDKENILGTRWLSLRATGSTANVKGYGIHGTWDETTIGKAESAGCVRMKNSDVEELYKLVPINTPVTITE